MSKFNFAAKADKFRSMKSAILEKMALNAINQFKVANFDAQGFVDTTLQRWPNRKLRTTKYKDNTPNIHFGGLSKDRERKILVKTGRMRQSITVISRGPDSITVGTDVPYAKYHNEGTKTIPQRKFIGKSAKLDAQNRKVLDSFIRRVL